MINFNPELPKPDKQEIHDFEGYEKKEFLVWRNLKIGTGIKTGDEFINSLEEKKIITTPDAKTLLKGVNLTQQEKELKLVRVTLQDLGFKEMPSLKAINQRAVELGLQICPPEIGPYLREQYTDQPKNTWLMIGMEPVMVKDYKDKEYPITFVLIEEDGLCLHSTYNENVQVHEIYLPYVFLKSED